MFSSKLLLFQNETYYEYVSKLSGQPNICLSESEMENIMGIITDLKETDFVEKNCIEEKKYTIDLTKNCCMEYNFIQAYTHFINKIIPKQEFFCYAPEGIYDLKFEITNVMGIKYFNPSLIELLKRQKDEEIVVANISIKKNDKKTCDEIVEGHHIVACFIKKENDVSISLYDTKCQTEEDKLKFTATFKSIFRYLVKLSVNLKISFEFDEYIELNRIHDCYSFYLQRYDNLFNVGLCASWGLYFLHQIISKKSSFQIYDELKDIYNPSIFMYIWHDILFSKVKDEIKV